MIKPDDQSRPWRRSYGPALNLALLDQGIFLGSAALTLMLILFSAAGLQQFVELNDEISYSTKVPLSIAFVGGFMIYVGGEIDRWKQLRSKYDGTYKMLFLISVGILIFAIILGALMNPESVTALVSRIPYIAAGAALSFLVAFAVVKFHSSRPLPTDPSKEPAIV